ncbi:MAG TPA: pyocin knob domain-containing protein, partial [Steroidobacteraceae bacterium]|nr:pyocin knob domain-containing protein [Steroidobacteraceae bacterium]
DISSATFITADDETATLANSLKLVAGSNVTFDTSTPGELKISASGGGGGGTVESVIGTTNEIDVDSSDPANPVVSLANAVKASLALADSAVQPGDLADVAFSGDYSSLTGIPATFPPSAHTHSADDITSGTLSNSRLSGVLAHRGEIGPGADLNTYTTTGIWHQNFDVGAASGTNYPVPLAGMLRVYAHSAMVYQEYFAYGWNATYIRKYYDGVWYPWHQVYDSGHKPSLADLGGGTITGNAAVAGTLTINAGGPALSLKPGSQDRTFMEFYADSDNPNSRSAYFGFAFAGTSRIELVNEMAGDIYFQTGGRILFQAPTIAVQGRGGVLHYGDTTFTTARVFVRQGGSPVGTQEGDITIIW